jgi:transposase
MSEKRRQYTEECRRDAVRLVTEHGHGVTEAARNLGIHGKLWGRWKRQAAQEHPGALSRHGPLSADHEALRRWRTEGTRLRMEREIVTNTGRFFGSASRGNRPAFWNPSGHGPCRLWGRCWESGAAGGMTRQSVRRCPPAVAKSAPCLRVSRRSQPRRPTGMAVVACPRSARPRGRRWGASRGGGACNRPGGRRGPPPSWSKAPCGPQIL